MTRILRGWLIVILNCYSFFLMAQTGKSLVVGDMIDRPSAIMVLNPPDRNQGFLVPQLSTTLRLSMHPSSPSEDGLLVFDITDKSFYYWKDNAWVKGLGNEMPALQYDPVNHVLKLGNSTQVNLSGLQDLPPLSGQSGKYLMNDGISTSWSMGPAANDNQDLNLTGNTLNLTNDPTPINLNSLTANGQVRGQLSTLTIAPNSITTAQIQNSSITPSKLATAGVTDANKYYSTDAAGVPRLETKSNLLSGVTAGGDLTGTFPSPGVARLQGNSVSPATLNASDAGKVLVWNGTVWNAQSVAGVSPSSNYVMIDPSDFYNLRTGDKKDKDNMIIFDDNSTYVTTIKRNEGPTIIAPVRLPHGATLEQVTVYYMDRESRNVEFDLLRKTPAGSNDPVVAGWTSAGSSGAIRTSSHVPVPGKEIIDNENYSYRIVVKLDQTNDVNDSSDADLRVYAVRIKYRQ